MKQLVDAIIIALGVAIAVGVITMTVLYLNSIPVIAKSTEASKIEYRVRRTIDQEAGVICWTAFTESDVSMDCMLLKNTNLIEAK